MKAYTSVGTGHHGCRHGDAYSIIEIAKKYDAACTPDFYLYDNELKLVYRGQLDDSRPGNGIECDGKDLSYAIKCLIKNIENDKIQKPSIGCNIKWK